MEFLSLSYDILRRTLQHMDDDELYVLGLLCRRLNLIAFEVFLCRRVYSISYGAIRLCLPQDLMTITILRLAFFSCFPPSLKRLVCEFSHAPEDHEGISHDFHRFLDLFHVTQSMPTSLDMVMNRLALVELIISPNAPVDLGALFQTVLSKCKSCWSLKISYSNNIILDHTRRPQIFDPRATLHMVNCYRKLLEKPPPNNYPSYSWSKRLSKAKFVNIIIHVTSSVHFPECFTKITKDLKSVHYLYLPRTPRLWGEAWVGVLSSISSTGSSLRSITLNPTGIYPYDLIQFLSHLPQLESLTISSSSDASLGNLSYTNEEKPKKRLTLRLRYLYATPAIAAVILAERLPKLRGLHLTAQGGTLLTPTSQKTFTKLSSSIKAQNYSAEVHLNIKFEQDKLFIDMVNDLDGYFQTNMGHSTTSSCALFAFTTITVHAVDPLYHQEYRTFLQALVQWLRLFKCLRRAIFGGTYSRGVVELPIYTFLRAIHSHCPSIQSVSASGVLHDISNILSKHEAIKSDLRESAVTIGDLNQDIFYEILQYLDTDTMYSMSTLCRNLRDWVLPVYLNRRGIFDISHVRIWLDYLDFEKLTDISALTLSLNGPMRHLHVVVHPRNNIFLVFEFLQRILRLIRKCTAITDVVLDLGIAQTIAVPHLSRQSKVAWTKLVFSIFCAVAEKAESLSVYGRGIFGGLTLSHLDCGWNGEHAGPIRHTLARLNMDTASLTLPVLHTFLTDKLRGSMVMTSMVVVGLTSLGLSHLRAVAVAFPMISTLTLSGHDIMPEDILSILCQLPLLEDLCLDGCQWYFGGGTWNQEPQIFPIEAQGPVPVLSRLRTLVTSALYANFLLIDGNCLSRLERLTIKFLFLNPTPSWAHPITVLHSLAGSVQNLKPHLHFSYLSLSFIIPSIINLTEDEMTGAGWEIVAQSTANLTLQQLPILDRSITPLQAAQKLQQWLKLFPALRSINFEDITNHEWLNDVLFSLPIHYVCRTVQAVLVNGTIRPLAPGVVLDSDNLV